MSNPASVAVGSPQDWLRHARSDLACAQVCEKDPDILPNQTAFHAQQAAEKAIKGVLILRGIAFPKTHDLKELVKRWTLAGHPWPADLEGTKTLSPYAVETRYPGCIQQISRKELREAIESAAWAEAIANPPPPPAGSS